MIEKRYIDLMNSEIDGDNSPEESRELEEYMARSPEARRHFKELREVGRALADAGEASPPPGLRRSIMNAVEARERAAATPGLLTRIRRAVAPPVGMQPAYATSGGAVARAARMRFAYAFAGGVVAGLALFVLLSVTVPRLVPGDVGNLYGTIGSERCFVEEPLSFSVPGAEGYANIRYCAETVTVELSLSSDSEVVVVLAYDEQVDFNGLQALQPGDHAIRVSGHRAELTHSGTRDYDLTFTDHTESHLPMSVSVMEGGRALFESSVPPDRG